MLRLLSSALGALAISTTLLAPLTASAAAVDHRYTIDTRMVEESPGVGEFDGSLQLHVSAQGIVSGYYRPNDDGRFVPVTGGINGKQFWIDIGSFAPNPWRFSGTFANGHIDAVSNSPVIDDGRFTGLELIGTPKHAAS